MAKHYVSAIAHRRKLFARQTPVDRTAHTDTRGKGNGSARWPSMRFISLPVLAIYGDDIARVVYAAGRLQFLEPGEAPTWTSSPRAMRTTRGTAT